MIFFLSSLVTISYYLLSLIAYFGQTGGGSEGQVEGEHSSFLFLLANHHLSVHTEMHII